MYPLKEIQNRSVKTIKVGNLLIPEGIEVHESDKPWTLYHLSDRQQDAIYPQPMIEPLVSLDQKTPRIACGKTVLACFYLNKSKLIEYVFARERAIKSRWFSVGMILSAFETQLYLDPKLNKVDRNNEEAWLVDTGDEGKPFKPVEQLSVNFLGCPEYDDIEISIYNPSQTYQWRLTENTWIKKGRTFFTLRISPDCENWLSVVDYKADKS